MRISDWSSDVCSSDLTMADKIVVMHDGNGEQIGAPLDLYDHPAILFVAGFIGSPAMNFIEGRVSLNGTARFISEAGVELPLNGAPGARDGQSAIYGVRPEHLALSDDGVEAEVIVVEPTGSRSEEHKAGLQSPMRIAYDVFCLKKK